MKILLVSILIIASITSCKKNGADCKRTMAAIAGSYKLTKFEKVSYSTGAATDVTADLSACESAGIYNFNANGTADYTELQACNGSGTGNWTLADGNLYISFSSGNGGKTNGSSITSWNCKNLVLITTYPSVDFNYRTTLTKF